MTSNSPAPSHRLDTVLAYTVAVLVVLSIAAFFAVLIGGLSGMKQADFAGGAWPAVTFFPWFGLPVGFLVLMTLLVMNGVRRRRDTRSID